VGIPKHCLSIPWASLKQILLSRGLVLAPLKPGYTFLVLSPSVDPFLALSRIPPDSGLIFPVAGSVLVCGREQLLL
jgi:hypothetical protein